jgi:hypothetical protein
MEERQGPSGFGKVIDILSRPLYGAAAVADAFLDVGEGKYTNDISQAIGDGVNAFFTGGERETFGDLMKKYNPDFARDNPWAAAVTGLALDVILDPLTYVGVGPATKLINATGKGVSIMKTKKFKKLYDSVVVDHAARVGSDAYDNRAIVDMGFAELLQPSRTRWVHDAEHARITEKVAADRASGNLKRQRTVYPNTVPNGEHVMARAHQVPADEIVDRFAQDGLLTPWNQSAGRDLRNEFTKYRNVDSARVADLSLDKLKAGTSPRYKSAVHVIGQKTYQDYVILGVGDTKSIAGALRFEVTEDGVRKFHSIATTKHSPKGWGKSGTPALDTTRRQLLESAYDDMGDELFRALDSPVAGMTEAEARTLINDSIEVGARTNKPITTAAMKGFERSDAPRIRALLGEEEAAWRELSRVKSKIRTAARKAEVSFEDLARKPGIGLGIVGIGRLEVGHKLADWAHDLGIVSAARSLAEVAGSNKWIGAALAVPAKVKTGLATSFSKQTAIEVQAARGFGKETLEEVGGAENFANWYRNELNAAEAEMKYIEEAGVDRIQKLYNNNGHFTPERRKVMGDRMLAMEEAYLKKVDELGLTDMSQLKFEDVDKIRKSFMSQMTGEEIDMIAGLTNLRVQTNNFRTSNSLLKAAIQVRPYLTKEGGAKILSPRQLAKTKRDAILQAHAPGGNSSLLRGTTKEELTKLQTVRDLENAGFRVERDAIALALFDHQSAMRKQRLDDLKTAIELKTGEKFHTLGTKLVPEIGKDLEHLGGFAGFNDASEDLKGALGFLESMQTYFFKVPATILKPAFAMKQMIGNGIQAMSANGLGSYSIPAMQAAGNFTFRGQKINGILKTVHGQVIDEAALRGMLTRNPVVKNVTVEGLGVGGHSAARHTQQVMSTLSKQGFPEGQRNAMQYMVQGVNTYMNWPGHVEDFHRMAVFLTQIQKGVPEKQAFDMMEKALFNYTTGLSNFERKWMKNLVPFYQFSRFSTALAKDVLKSPGNMLTVQKSFEVFGESYRKVMSAMHDGNNEQLTDEERGAIPGFLMEQPRTFMGFDPEMRGIFATFNSFNFMEVADMIHFKKDSEGIIPDVDWETTMKKGLLAQVTPFIKVPIELAFKESMFTERAFYKEGHYIGEVDPQAFISAAGAAIGARIDESALGGLGGGVTAKLAAEALGRGGSEELLKFMLGWEVATDRRTGKQQVYVGPNRFNMFAGAIPAMTEIVNQSRTDRTMKQKVLKLILGVGTTSVDIAATDLRRRDKYASQLKRLRSDYLELGKSGRVGAAELKRQELETLMTEMMSYRTHVQRAQIRGEVP